MKNIFTYLILITLLLTSCFEEQMDIKPAKLLSPDKIFSDEEGVETALIGVYSRFSPGWYYYPIVFLEAYGNKDWYPGANQGYLLTVYETHIVSPAENEKGYKRLWSTITFANAFINNVNKFNPAFENPERKDQVIAEARFLRAFIYFQLVQIYGPVPLITDTKDYGVLFPSNSTIPEIYTQIEEDLNYCISVLPEVGTYESGRATKGAAQGILAKVLMTQHDEEQIIQPSNAELQKAVDLCTEVMSQYSLVKVYDDLWQRESFDNTEQIFSIASSSLGSGNGIHWPQYASHDYEPTVDFFNSFDSTIIGTDTIFDVRRFSTVYYDRMTKKYRDNKYRRSGQGAGGPNQTVANLYALRLSDIILLKAEALNKIDASGNVNEIVDLINQIRERAGAILVTPTECSSQEATALIIEEERHKELFFEFQEFFDLKRNNRLIEVLGDNGAGLGFNKSSQRLWPFPDSEINKNENLMQNEGY